MSAFGECPFRATSGHTQTDGIAMSAIVRTTDSSQTLRHVRDVPTTDSRAATINTAFNGWIYCPHRVISEVRRRSEADRSPIEGGYLCGAPVGL